MNDDLVERLNSLAAEMQEAVDADKWDGVTIIEFQMNRRDKGEEPRLLIEAADELTRLGKENERLYKLVLGRTDQAKKLRIENHDLRGEVASLRSGAAAREERA